MGNSWKTIKTYEVYNEVNNFKLPLNSIIIKCDYGSNERTALYKNENDNKKILKYCHGYIKNVNDFYTCDDEIVYLTDKNHFIISSSIDIVDAKTPIKKINRKVKEFVYFDDKLYILSDDSNVYTLSKNSSEQLFETNIKSIAASSKFLVLLKNDGDVLISNGVFGDIDKNIIIVLIDNKKIIKLDLKDIIQISCSKHGIMCRNKNNEVYVYCDDAIDKGIMASFMKRQFRYKLFKLDFNFEIIDIHMRDENIYVLNDKYEVYGSAYHSNFTDNNSYYRNATHVNRLSKLRLDNWSPKEHYEFPIYFKKAIYEFLKCMKRIQCETGIKIPKFVMYEIIKQAI